MTDLLRTTEVARILGVSPRRVRTMVRAGWCHPDKSGRAFTFQFQDLVLLRTAHGLSRARVPPRRVKRALSELLRQLPPERPLSGVRISAAGGQVVVRDRDAVWQRPWLLLRHLWRFPVPFLSFEQWKRSMARLYWLAADYRITCAVFEKV